MSIWGLLWTRVQTEYLDPIYWCGKFAHLTSRPKAYDHSWQQKGNGSPSDSHTCHNTHRGLDKIPAAIESADCNTFLVDSSRLTPHLTSQPRP